MAIAYDGDIGTTNSKTANQGSLSITLGSALTAGKLAVVVVAKDNTNSADGDNSEVTSVTDSVGGNTWTKIAEFTAGRGAAQGGATISAWKCVPVNTIGIGQTVTANFSDTTTNDATVMFIGRWTIAGGVTIEVQGTPQAAAVTNGDPGSLSLSGLPSREYLFIRVIAGETNDTAQLSAHGWSVVGTSTAFGNDQTSGGGAASNMAFRGNTNILTATGVSSDPTWTNCDNASLLFALYELSTTPKSLVFDPAPLRAHLAM